MGEMWHLVRLIGEGQTSLFFIVSNHSNAVNLKEGTSQTCAGKCIEWRKRMMINDSTVSTVT